MHIDNIHLSMLYMEDLKKYLLNKLPPVRWQNEINYISGTNENIIQTLLAVAPEAVKQAKPIAKQFKGKNDLESLRNIHSFIRKNLGYRKDPKGVQQIKMPNRFINESGDCKSNALFVYSIAKNLGIPIDFKFANYYKWQGKTPSHVYNVAFDKKSNKFVYVDGTSSKFGTEAKKPNFSKNGGLMQIQTLSNNMEITGKGILKKAIKKAASNVKGEAKLIAKKVKEIKPLQKIATGALVAQRSAFLALVRLNFRGLASKLAKVMASNRQGDFKKKWNTLGGNYTSLQDAVKAGQKKPALFGGINSVAVAAGTVAAATPILTALASFIGKLDQAVETTNKIKNSPAVQKVNDVLKKNPTLNKKLQKLKGKAKQTVVDKIAQTTGQSPEQVNNIIDEAKQTVSPDSPQNEQPQDSPAPMATSTKILIGAALLGAGYYAFKSN